MPRPPVPLSDLARVEDGEDLVAGRRPVEEAFAARRPARRLLVVPDRRHALEQLVLHATTLRIPVVEVEGGTLTSLAGFDGHQGVALVVEPRRWATIDEVLARARERGEPPFLLVLDSLEDPQNVGTMLRSAEACGVHGVIFPTRRAAPISPAAIKASAGAVEHLLLVPLDDLAGGLVDLRTRGLRLVGADESASLAYREADLRGPLALVVGSEGHGISGAIRRRIDLAVRIPMRGRVGSLNAAVAGSVLLFEAAAQRPSPGMASPGPEPSPGPEASPGRETSEAAIQSQAPTLMTAATQPPDGVSAAAEAPPVADAPDAIATDAEEPVVPGVRKARRTTSPAADGDVAVPPKRRSKTAAVTTEPAQGPAGEEDPDDLLPG